MAASDHRTRDGLLAAAALAFVLAVVALGNLLPRLAQPVVPSTPAAFEAEPTCAEWSDGCIVCERGAGGVACSMPGIACVRSEPKCLRREGT
jgi:hypothetical protein